MTSSLEEAKNLFNRLIRCYVGLDNNNINENQIRTNIIKIAYDNRANYKEFAKIIIYHLEKDKTQYKIRLFDLIDILFKNHVGNYVEQLMNYLPSNFQECYQMCDFQDRFLLYRIFYTWKYIVPKEITKKIKDDLKLDDFKEYCKKNLTDFDAHMKSCEEYNENLKKAILKKNAENLNIKKDFKEDKSQSNNNVSKQNKTIEKQKNNLEENSINSNDKILNKKRKSSHEKSSEGNSKPKKKVKPDNKINNADGQKTINTTQSNLVPTKNNISNINNLISPVSINQNNNINNIIQFMNNCNNQNQNQNIINNISNQVPDKQQPIQTILNLLIRNNLINNPSLPLFPNPQSFSLQEFIIFHFLAESMDSKIKLNTDLRFFSSLAKFFNESIKNKDIIKIKCEYEDIYKNPEYQQIRQNVNNSLFGNIKKNICTICGFRTLYYNKLTEHLDIHFNINYLKKEGKNLFRKKGNNRNNWIRGENKNIKSNNMNEVGYTLNNLLYYKNMINNNIKKLDNLQQEDDNEELMYPIDGEYIRCCEFCGDPFKKVFSNKYYYWFYTEIIRVKDEKTKLLVHKACYDEMTKKI